MIKLLSNQDQYILSEKTEKNQEVTGLKFGNRSIVNYTYNVLGEFSICQTLTSISDYYLTILAYFFPRDIYTMYMI